LISFTAHTPQGDGNCKGSLSIRAIAQAQAWQLP
jgi:hypothetical protein